MDYKNIKASLIPYDQNEIETVMKQLLLKNGVEDVRYPGSNISQLTSVIAYAISSLNVNTAINMQETILPLASKRMNVLMGARELGYEPSQQLSYKYKATIKPEFSKDPAVMIPDPNDPTKTVVDTSNDTFKFDYSIETYTEFVNGDYRYWYTGPRVTVRDISNFDIQHINSSQGKPKDEVLLDIELIEGVLTTSNQSNELQINAIDYQEDGILKTKQDYLVPFKNLEENEGIRVFLTYIDKFGATVVREPWTKSEQFLVDDSLDYNKNKFVRMHNIILNYPAVFFEFAGLGKGIRSKTIIEVDVLESSGAAGQAKGEFVVKDPRASEVFGVLEYVLVQAGSHEETMSSIKENAIVFHNTGNRAVTRLDYIAISRRHGLVSQGDAWGGEEETPKVKGEIWLSCTPENQTRPVKESFTQGKQIFEVETGSTSQDKKDDIDKNRNWRNWYLTDPEQKELLKYVDVYKIMTMGLNYRHPLYIDFEYDMKIVKYDMHKTPEETNKQLFDVMNSYFQNKIENFESEYLDSNTQRILDTALEYKSGVNYSLKLYGVLNDKMLDPYYSKRLIVNLAWPFENILPNGISADLDITKIPKIDTTSFGKVQKALTVDYNGLIGKIGTVRETEIKLDGTKVGTYRINILKNVIELDFIMDAKNLKDFFGDASKGLTDYARFEIVYPPYDNNIVNADFAKNVAPRLKKVQFNY